MIEEVTPTLPPAPPALPQDAKWVFKYVNKDTGLTRYTPPEELSDLITVVDRLKIEGEFCLCVIIPDFKAKVTIDFDYESSSVLNGIVPALDIDKIKEGALANVRENSENAPRRRGRPRKIKA